MPWHNNDAKISVVIPAYNEERNLIPLKDRLIPILQTFYDYEILFIDDGSKDSSLSVLKTLSQENPRIRYIAFSRNFGHQAALRAGLERSAGDAVITMDADLQHPPELIPLMVEKWREENDVVFTIRSDVSVPFFKKTSSRIFYSLLNFLSATRVEAGAADFRLIDRRLVEILKGFQEKAIFLRGLISWLGFKQTAIHYTASPRNEGESRYSAAKMVALAWDAVTSFSILPLRLSMLAGLLLSILSLLYGLYILYAYFLRPDSLVSGWV